MLLRLLATIRVFLCCAAVAGQTWAAASEPVGTGFTYQGQLKQGGNPVDATADFQFTLFDEAISGSTIGATLPINNVTIVDGLFTVDLDFGASAFGSQGRWLDIAVRSPAGAGTFTVLSPRQRIRLAPAAQFSLASGSVGDGGLPPTYSSAVALTNAANTFSGSGAGLTNLNASNFASGTLGSSLLSGTYSNALTLSNASNTIAGSGAGLTNLNAGNLSTGTVPSGRLFGVYSNPMNFTNPGNNFVGSGGGLTNLNAGNLFGTVPSQCLNGTYSNPVTFNSGFFAGIHVGDGGSLTTLNASALVTGTVPDGALTGANGSGLVGLSASNVFSGTLANARTTGTSANTANTLVLRDATGDFSAGTITADGSGLTDLNAGNISTGNLNIAHMPTGGSWTLSSALEVMGPADFVPGIAVYSNDYNGIEGITYASIACGVFGKNFNTSGGSGVVGLAASGAGVGVHGVNTSPTDGRGVVGQASGPGSFAVFAQGNSGASGTKAFQIDDPRDPENKYLVHYSAEGPEPFNLYRGNVVLNGVGEGWVELPDYFEDINRDFHYQLTPIGAPSPDLHVALEIVNNRFMIAGGRPGTKVSWTVTAVRNDEYVRHYPTTDVREKPAHLKGTYQHPEIFGQPADKGEPHLNEALANQAE